MSRAPSVIGVRTLTLAIGAGIGACWWLVDGVGQRLDPGELVWFVLAVLATERLELRQPGGRPVATSLAVLGTAAILGAAPVTLTAMAGVSWFVGRLLARDRLVVRDLVGRMISVWALSGFAALGATVVPTVWQGSGTDLSASLPVGGAVAVGMALVVGLPAGEVLARTQGRFNRPLRRISEAVLATRLVGPAVAATAGLGALVHPVLGGWTLPTMLIPLLAARVGLERLFVADEAYEQTIRAMSRLPEKLDSPAGHAIEDDHGVRVGRLAYDVAIELGISERDTIEIVRAAHLHELGRVKLEVGEPASRQELATVGGQAVRQVSPRLEGVARIVESHGRLAGVTGEVDQRMIHARIVAACCEVDSYAPDPSARGQRDEMVVRLVREVGDLTVVGALTRVLDRQSPEA